MNEVVSGLQIAFVILALPFIVMMGYVILWLFAWINLKIVRPILVTIMEYITFHGKGRV